MQPLTLSDVLSAFDPIDRPDVKEPNLDIVRWDDRDFLSWRHHGEAKAYLVVPLKERLVGIVLTMSTSAHAGICDFCLSVDREAGAASAMVHSWAKPRIAYGVLICSNLECCDSVRGLRAVYRMGETISVGRRIERLQENVGRFARLISGVKAAR